MAIFHIGSGALCHHVAKLYDHMQNRHLPCVCHAPPPGVSLEHVTPIEWQAAMQLSPNVEAINS